MKYPHWIAGLWCLFLALATWCLPAFGARAQNLLINGDFETSPPPGNGEHLGVSVPSWVDTHQTWTNNAGNQMTELDLVTVDGPGGYDYGSHGPESDATAPGAGVAQHYLDTLGMDTVYQSFTASCGGMVSFGGDFSTRDNSRFAKFTVELRAGTGANGALVAGSGSIPLPPVISKTGPWYHESLSANLTAGATYSLVVTMDDDANLDNAFVTYGSRCLTRTTGEAVRHNTWDLVDQAPPVNPCCPPFNSTLLQSMLHYQGASATGGLGSPYTVTFQPTAAFNAQMQAYIDYLHTLDPDYTDITIDFSMWDGGSGSTAVAGTSQLGADHWMSWHAGGGGVPLLSPALQSTSTGYAFFPNTLQTSEWYVVHSSVYLNDDQVFFPVDCVNVDTAVRLKPMALKPNTGAPWSLEYSAAASPKAARVKTSDEIDKALAAGKKVGGRATH